MWIEKDAVKEPPEEGQYYVTMIDMAGNRAKDYIEFTGIDWICNLYPGDTWHVVSYLTPTTLPARFTQEEINEAATKAGVHSIELVLKQLKK